MVALDTRNAVDRWEPSIGELMADPIFDLLLRRDGLTRTQVQSIIERAVSRLAAAGDTSRPRLGADWRPEPVLHA